ncbi:MAG: acetyl-CoA C-acetyltransferase [Filimonas sp.]|nr:acetyl-CoA C-acetyltransferase [Filimonas sp.]
MKKAVIVGGQRIPFTKSYTNYANVTNQQMLIACIEALIDKYKLEGKTLGEVACGALMKAPSDFSLTRESVLGTRLDPHTPAYDVQRACGTSLDTTIQICLRIIHGQIDVGIAGGSDTNSDIPLVLQKSLRNKLFALRKAKRFAEKLKIIFGIKIKELSPVFPAVVEPRTGLSMGQHTERMVQEWNISREEQDKLAYESHMKASKAYDEGFYKKLVVPFQGIERDTIIRSNTTLEALAALKPVFDRSEKGTLTAGNSTLLTDGAAAVLIASEEYAQSQGWPVLAHFVDAQTAAVDYVNGEGLLMAPTRAIPVLLQRNNLTLQDFDIYEIHEAFSGQVLCTLKAWEDEAYCKSIGLEKALGSIDRTKLNIKGGSVAIGHPFAATGARIVAQTAELLAARGGGRALISICTAGGMGVAAILEA